METCPTCHAALKGEIRCRRCKTDLSRAADTASKAESHRLAAVEAYRSGRYEEMRRHAGRSFSLQRTPKNTPLFACAALLCGDYGLAVKLWKLHTGVRPTDKPFAPKKFPPQSQFP
ncbi:MAG: hypothetical protein C4530_09425 [Desulfobacteraceae bacterium]|nr:MAG: hypothetical protein C4530_09425 [Desulfobacteraceae bacterium]